MKLYSCFLALSLAFTSMAVGSENKQEKPSWIAQKIDDAKKSAQRKIKKKKDKIKHLLRFSASGAPKDQFEYLCYLQKSCEEGSLEAYNEACQLFGVSNIYGVQEAFAYALEPFLKQDHHEELEFVLCGKYIGDDGLEYDDGLDDEIVEELSFYSIPLHQWEKKIIEKIVSSLAERTLAQLLLDRKEMEKRGDQVRHVHPLRFMGHIFHDPYLKGCLPQFKNSPFKWSNFIDGFVQKMREEMARNNVNKHLEGFCEYLDADLEKVGEFVSKGQYEELIYFLMEN